MKKTFILSVILLILIMSTVYSYAGSYTFNDGGISIELPDGTTVYTENSDVSKIEGAPEDFDLLVTSDSPKYYWYFYYINNRSTIDFASLSDDKIMELVKNDSQDIETDDVSHEIYNNGNKYLVVDSLNKDTGEYIHYYVTGVGNALYYFIAPSKDAELGDAQKADLKNVIDGLSFVRKEAPTKQEERQAAMIRIFKRFGLCVAAIVIFVVVRDIFLKIKGKVTKK